MTKRAKKSRKKTSHRRQGLGIKRFVEKTIREILDVMDQSETLEEFELRLKERRPPMDDGPGFEAIERQMYLETPRFLESGYRIEQSAKKTKHQLGGTLAGKAPTCGCCGKALVLFANLDVTDLPLQVKYPAARCPLYYCCSCPGPVYYRISKAGNAIVLSSENEPYDEAPFETPPEVLAVGHLSLKPIDPAIESPIFDAVQKNAFRSLDESQLATITAVLGRKPAGRWDLYFSQLGGVPLSYQGDEGKPSLCPNRACPYRRRKRREYQYRPLAVLDLWNDKFWGIKPMDAVQIVYHICPGCACVSAKYTCT